MDADAQATNFLVRWTIEIAFGVGVLLLGLLKFIGGNALKDIRTLKEARTSLATKEDIKRLEGLISQVSVRIDQWYRDNKK